ncbi:MAG: DUF3450 family protein [Puniceicoccaceae bacterium]|nr:DUF3450 family protein [Puniceicoccaceae bacterium]
MKNKILLGIGLASALTVSHAQDTIGTTRDTLDQWVETQQIISKEKSDWKLEKSILQDTQNLLNRELERLTAALEELDASATAADEERTTLAAEKETLATASAVVEAQIGALETQVKAIVKTFPEPLVDKIQPLIRRIPKDPKNTKSTLGERVQNIVGILSQADKFNGTITQTSESREVGDGRVVEVRTIYWGLGGAFFVDAAGEYAGVGIPSENGWEWPEVEGSGPKIKRLLDVYEGSEDIQFVEVPVRIK